MPVPMLPPLPPDNRMAELDGILAQPARRGPSRANRMTANMTRQANARPTSERQKRIEDERMAIVEGERERELIRAAEHQAELAYLRAKGAA